MNIKPEILRRFFDGKYSRKDYLNVKSFFEDVESREELKSYLESHWLEFGNEILLDVNIDHLLQKIQHQIRLGERTGKTFRIIQVFQRVAAILVIPLLLAFFAVVYFQSEKETPSTGYAEIQCPLGVRTKFELPDGSTGFLNSGSKLNYPVSFSAERQVSLSGEAFFDVIQNPKQPFTVQTPNLEIEVLGTRFNVIAYENENTEEVILEQGWVEVVSAQSGKNLAILQPDRKLVLNTEKRSYVTTNVEAAQYIGWTEGKLIFRNEGMKQVAQRLGRWYNVDIEIEDPELLKFAFRATFIDEPLEEVLKLLAITAPLTYREQLRETTDNDIYKKRKVIVSLDQKRVDAF